MVELRHWLDELEDIFRSLSVEDRVPLCFLIGAGSSLSSNAPGTPDIVAALMAARPGMFPSPAAVYARVHGLSTDERTAITNRLFGRVLPHIGYRCLAAMARTRPIIIVNLNWDDCVIDACHRLGLSEDNYAAIHLEDTAEVAAGLEALLDRGSGLISVHVHGRLQDPEERDPRFGTKETLSFSSSEFEQLQSLLNFRTFVVGTSLSGPHDVTQLVEALRPPVDTPESRIKRLWVIERGPLAHVPSPVTIAGHNLTRALEDRRSTANFLAAPDVDFDMFMVSLRAAEVGYTWEHVTKDATALLPARSELVPPSPAVVRPLLDAPGLLVGRSDIGKLTVAHQVAHWLSILSDDPNPLENVRGGEAIARALEERNAHGSSTALVGDNLFGGDSFHPCEALVEALTAADDQPGAIFTSRPAPWFRAVENEPKLEEAVAVIPFQASRVWEESALKGYARSRSPLVAPDLEEAIERGDLATPKEIDRCVDKQKPLRNPKELTQLTVYLGHLRRGDEELAFALALIRLQDMAHAVPRAQLEEISRADLDRLIESPWDLVASIWIDDEYLRFARREAVLAVDKWLDVDRGWLTGRVALLGDKCRWVREALTRWELLMDFDSSGKSLDELDDATIELLGPELIEPALGISPKKAMAVLQVMFEAAPDAWAVREVGFELVRRWDVLRLCPKAHALRDELLKDTDRRGMYALFEGLLRQGGVGPLDLWAPVVATLTKMLGHLDEDGNRRQAALCFDALLWRPAPVDDQQNRMLLELLLEAADHDSLLQAAYAAAAAYHWDGTERLVTFELSNPVEDLGNVTEAEAREMAWVVEWHFVHQSRNRALASRRYFRSTRSMPVRAWQPRLLSRKPVDRPLPPAAASAVQRVVAQMGRFRATAGWALHMIVNVRSTAGTFKVRNLGSVVDNANPTDLGLVWAAITYEPERRLGEELRSLLNSDKGRETLQRALSGELELDRTPICTPRFVTTLDPWNEVRSRLRMDFEVLGDLGLPTNEPWRLIEVAREVRDEAIAEGASEEMVDAVIDQLELADTRLFDRVHSEEGFSERGRKSPKNPADLHRRVKTLLFLCAKLMEIERGPQ
jgi:hypothetical protein